MTTLTSTSTQTVEENKALVRRVIEEIFGQGRIESVDELLSEDFTRHNAGPTPNGRQGMKDTIARVSKGLADARMTIEDMIAEGDRVAVRLTSEARQVGEFMGLPPSGKTYRIGEIHIFRIEDGRVAEHWHEADFLGMMRQLGAMPTPGSA